MSKNPWGLINAKIPSLFFVYTPENAPEIIIRCYVRNSIIKGSSSIDKQFIMNLMNQHEHEILAEHEF